MEQKIKNKKKKSKTLGGGGGGGAGEGEERGGGGGGGVAWSPEAERPNLPPTRLHYSGPTAANQRPDWRLRRRRRSNHRRRRRPPSICWFIAVSTFCLDGVLKKKTEKV